MCNFHIQLLICISAPARFLCLWPTLFPYSAASPLFPGWRVPYRFLQVVAGQLAVLGVVVENRAQLKMRPSFNSLRRLKLKHRLQAVHAESDFWRTRCSKMLREAEKGEIPALWGLYVWRHFPRQQQVFQRYGQTPGLPGWVICYPQPKLSMSLLFAILH